MDFLNLFRRWRLPQRRWRVTTVVRSVHDVDETLRRRTAVMVGSAAYPKWLVFDCPCPDRHRVMINLDRLNQPSWTILSGEPLTLVPSVDEERPSSRCHYIIRNGRIRWC